MDATGSDSANKSYYDAFSQGYEKHRGGRDPGGYHDLLDQLESEMVRRFGTGGDVLEVGCGTGLVLERIVQFAKSAQGIDISEGMLQKARERGLKVQLGSATELPFESNSFDVTCSFKVLAHIPPIEAALAEMARVTRPQGVVIAEFYNPHSLRGLVKRYGPKGKIADGANETNVFTRYDSPGTVIEQLCPEGCQFIASRGLRITIPSAHVFRIPGLGPLWKSAEVALSDTPLNRIAGFWIAAFRKTQ
ncbi:MAG TPA: class I SAM-dependent methyltransferase [Polyangiaceae bacterium]|nr:class I SAM-dependent methyltransferase [Polyangiaceae bacterium]